MKRTLKRCLQLATCVHRIHHIHYSYGWMLWPLRVGWFPDYAKRWPKSGAWHMCDVRKYHDCSVTGVY